ncbi:hypothetical protein CMEL01_08609 [Colletotrichum melonis]|uniref:Uncharacterized protein n=4 Tax=Colletotrichum acutatum species complex TaxID=2707335 RepID=A0AAI9XGK6_9PEZI|nr:hypothetical protein CMEL01_08609 [Colletotrichum melonis]
MESWAHSWLRFSKQAPRRWLPKRRRQVREGTKADWATKAKGRVGPGLEWSDGQNRSEKQRRRPREGLFTRSSLVATALSSPARFG